ncbi:MAG: glutamyl-tRNA reductase [Robiginitomaculum sp.]|nr:MAG: glutamyl-tRNA reductase [Robiginitomaculum sp.]
MKRETKSKYNSFYCVGLSFRKANVDIRGRFTLDPEHQKRLLDGARAVGISDVFVVSTCNRTEVYGFAEHPFQLIKLLIEHSQGSLEDFQEVGSVFKNNEAISHMFKVGSGLDSQILGDFEIIGQLRQSLTVSKDNGLTNSYLERLVNFVVQASKRIKTETDISSGATSVAYAAVQYILGAVSDIGEKNILLFGTGVIGRNTCENLVKHTNNTHITLVNRTKDSAEEVAGKFNLIVKDYDDLTQEIHNTDILIVATGAPEPTIIKQMIQSGKQLLVVDLSIPANVASDVGEHENVTTVYLDELSQITDENIAKRRAQIPRAEIIIAEVEAEFNAWLETRKFAPVVKALRVKLEGIAKQEITAHSKKHADFNALQADMISERIVQKITNRFANHLKENRTSQAESISFIANVFQLDNLLDD